MGIDEIIARAGVAKATLYRHFPSKDELVLGVLARREQLWTHDRVEAGARARAATPEDRLLAIFDVLDEWFRGDEFDACLFMDVLLEIGAQHPTGRASVQHLANVRAVVEKLATEAGLRDAEEFAHEWHILMKGAIVARAEGDLDAARRAAVPARLLIQKHR